MAGLVKSRGSAPKERSALTFKYKQQHGVIVICAGEEDQKRVYGELHERGYRCKVVTV